MEMLTLSMSKWRLARKFNLLFIDTTVRSGEKTFAPTWEIVRAIKSGRISEDEYGREYRRLMLQSWMANRERWIQVMSDQTPQAFACYCAAGEFCHRHLLRKYFEELCRRANIPFRYYGELI